MTQPCRRCTAYSEDQLREQLTAYVVDMDVQAELEREFHTCYDFALPDERDKYYRAWRAAVVAHDRARRGLNAVERRLDAEAVTA